MAVTPTRQSIILVAQDDRGFKSVHRIISFDADITANATPINTIQAAVAGVGTAFQAMTNAKIVSTGFAFEFDIAQEPSTETGTYQLVIQGAHLEFGDGATEKEFLTVPAPKDALFLTSGQDNLIVVNPAASILTAFQSSMSSFTTPSGGTWGAQFFGGQLREGKPRRRRVLQGA